MNNLAQRPALDRHAIDALVRQALDEDIGDGDLSTALLPETTTPRQAVLVANEDAVLCGRPWFESVFRQLDAAIVINWNADDGDAIAAGQTLCTLHGAVGALLTGERTAINFLQTLSGTATTTRHYADRLSGTKTTLLDTRKTLPGLRYAQKYAVRCGGGHNHRRGLFDGILLKENHIAAYGSITQAVAAAKTRHPDTAVEIEVETLADLHEALAACADIVMLDNFSLDAIRQAVLDTDGRAKLEASGGIDEDSLSAVAATGVDYISVGALTKHIRAIDLSLRMTAG